MKWLKAIRIKNGMKQQEIADYAGIKQSTYSNIERGVRKPSVITAKKLAIILEFTWTDFF